jgi:hypothetical protein
MVGSHFTWNLRYHDMGLPEIGLAYPAISACETGSGEIPGPPGQLVARHRRWAAGAGFNAVLIGQTGRVIMRPSAMPASAVITAPSP